MEGERTNMKIRIEAMRHKEIFFILEEESEANSFHQV
jgi:hypothetical protein